MTDDAQTGLAFTKMHGLGNDFVVIDRRVRPVTLSPAQIRHLCDRRFGVGCDLLCFIDRSDRAAARLSFFNADGSPAQACGNATRCAARLLGGDAVEMEGPVGPLRVERPEPGLYAINMGPPATGWQDIPLAEAVDVMALPIAGAPAAVGIGNPHMVFEVPDAAAVDPASRGPALERHPLFPARTNVEFASVIGPDRIRMRVWERGCGVTMACGSGACASLVALHRKGRVGRRADLILDGGTLRIDWRADGVWMTGPATHVYTGALATDFFDAGNA